MITISIGTPNSDISKYTGPYGQVEVNRTDSTHATITFTSLTAGGNIYLMGAVNGADLNVNGDFNIVPGSLMESKSGTGFSAPDFANGGTSNVSQFGRFNITLDGFDGFTHSVDTIVLKLYLLSGTWSSAADVLVPNNKGFEAAMHAFVTSSPANAANGALATGFAGGATGTTPIPEPASVLLLGTGLFSLISFGRRHLS